MSLVKMNSSSPGARVIALVLGTCVSTQVAVALDPQNLELGNWDIIPTLYTDFLYDDNVFQSSSLERGSYVATLNPRIAAAIEDRGNTYSVTAEIIEGLYSHSSVDDYTDWRLEGNADMQILGNQSLELSASLFDTHESRGSGLSRYSALPDELIEFELNSFGLAYELGTEESQSRLVLDFDIRDKSYQNAVENGFSAGVDYKLTALSAKFYVQSWNRINLNLEAVHRQYNHDSLTEDSNGTLSYLDSTERGLFVGVELEPTVNTSGTFKLGFLDKRFDQRSGSDDQQVSYDGSLQWQIFGRSYSALTFTARQEFEDSPGFADGRSSRLLGVTWEHNWRPRITTAVNYNDSKYSYLGDELDESFKDMGLSFRYNFRRWIDLRVEFVRSELNTNESAFAYKTNSLIFGMDLSL